MIASFTERRADIARQLQAAAERIGGGVIPIDDPALLDEVTADLDVLARADLLDLLLRRREPQGETDRPEVHEVLALMRERWF